MTCKVLYCKSLNLIDGKAYVVHPDALPTGFKLEDWLEHVDHYYTDLFCDSSEPESLEELLPLSLIIFKTCTECMEEQCASIEEQTSLLESHGPLRGLELFAGAGGLSTGIDSTGFVQTKWAVEYIPTIAHTYR